MMPRRQFQWKCSKISLTKTYFKISCLCLSGIAAILVLVDEISKPDWLIWPRGCLRPIIPMILPSQLKFHESFILLSSQFQHINSYKKFSHATASVVASHVQKIVVGIGLRHKTYNKITFSYNLNWIGKMLSQMGSFLVLSRSMSD